MAATRREFLRGAAGAFALLAAGATSGGGARVLTRVSTPSGHGAPDLIVHPTAVLVGPGATQGVDDVGGAKETVVSAATLTAQPVTAIAAATTAYVFLAGDGSAAWLDADVAGGGLPVGSRAFRVGRAWRAASGDWISCRGRRSSSGDGGTQVVYEIAGDPGPASWFDDVSDGPVAWTRTTAPFNGAAGGMTYDALATVSGGGEARLRIVNDDLGSVFELPSLPTGRDQPVQLILGNIGDVLELQTDVGTTIELGVTKGTETV